MIRRPQVAMHLQLPRFLVIITSFLYADMINTQFLSSTYLTYLVYKRKSISSVRHNATLDNATLLHIKGAFICTMAADRHYCGVCTTVVYPIKTPAHFNYTQHSVVTYLF